MDKTLIDISNKLIHFNCLSVNEYEFLISNYNIKIANILAQSALLIRKKIYGNKIFIRGLIEISNICKNDCLYCGIRHSNKNCDRYRLSCDQIIKCTDKGYDLGFRTFVFQGGEDPFFTDEILCPMIKKIKQTHPDCAITLSLGERSKKSYQNLFNAGADRYLLRHETADKNHYYMLHPKEMSFENRITCLKNLKEIGYAVGCGFMVGSPYQTPYNIAQDLKFIETFKPDMCGIGPFIPQHDTPFGNMLPGTVEQTCYLLSIIRLISPNILLPATTALGTIDPLGREKGILSGANVLMPNLSPLSVRKKYELYDNKICTKEESAENKDILIKKMESIGYKIVIDRGDKKILN